MCLLLETIRIENGHICNLMYHQERMNHARKILFRCSDRLNLAEIINAHLSSAGFAIRPQKTADLQSLHKKQSKPHKCRIKYVKEIQTIEFIPYKQPSINSLKIAHDDQIDYAFKYNDRSPLNELFAQKANCDDILIVKQGFITDTSYANILFYNGKEWLTPTHPLLNGVQRASLLDRELIQVADIRPEDLKHFQKARLINAMIRFEDKLDIKIDHIYF